MVEANVGNAAVFGEFQRRLRRVLERPLQFSHLALVFEHLRWNEHEFAEESTDGGVVSAKNQKRDGGDQAVSDLSGHRGDQTEIQIRQTAVREFQNVPPVWVGVHDARLYQLTQRARDS